MLTLGSAIPNLTLQGSDGERIGLAALRGGPVLLYVMRAASCAICNAHVRDLIGRQADLDAAGVRVLVVLPEGQAQATKWRNDRRIPFTAATGDVGGEAPAHGDLCFARRLLGSMQQSGTVLIDSAGTVRHTRVSTMPTGAYDKAGLWAAIAELGSAPAPAAREAA